MVFLLSFSFSCTAAKSHVLDPKKNTLSLHPINAFLQSIQDPEQRIHGIAVLPWRSRSGDCKGSVAVSSNTTL